MKFHEFTAYLADTKTREQFVKLLKKNPKAQILNTLQDYYDGIQWDLANKMMMQGETRHTRSGKEMWKSFDDNKAKGLSIGELKVWNLIKAAIDIYSRYTRGDDQDDIVIQVKKKVTDTQGKVTTVNDDALSDEASNIFWEPNNFVMSATTRMSVNSVLVIKYKKLDGEGENQDEVKILKKIFMSDDDSITGTFEDVDPRTILPIYWNDKIRGYVRFYFISQEEAQTLITDNEVQVPDGYKVKKDPLYWEAWYINDSAEVQLEKYVENLQIVAGKAPYDFIPFAIASNSKHPFRNFSLHCIEGSDVEDLIDLQDDINAFLTDLGIIFRKVAIPMLKATDEFMKSAKDGDIEKVKKSFSKISTMAGQILFAPIEKVNGTDVGPGTIKYLDDLKDQFYTLTNIPKSVFNSEGLSNIAAQTMEYLYTSLSKRIGDKRTKITEVIKTIVEMHLRANGKWTKDLEVAVIFPDIFGLTKLDRITMIQKGKEMEVLPKKYIAEKTIDVLGDGENSQEILGELQEQDVQMKQQIENVIASTRLNATQNQGNNQAVNQAVENKNPDLQNLPK